MDKKFILVFDEVILGQLKKLGEDVSLRILLSKMFDKMESLGPRAGKLLDSRLFLYEIKSNRPPVRLYFKHVRETNELYVFQYELKTSESKQRKTISELKQKAKNLNLRE